MNEPLATAAGNALEVRNAVDFLTGKHRDRAARDVTMALGAGCWCSPGLRTAPSGAESGVAEALASGAAAERFERMVAALGGPGGFGRALRST